MLLPRLGKNIDRKKVLTNHLVLDEMQLTDAVKSRRVPKT
jgi:hypothetical protein